MFVDTLQIEFQNKRHIHVLNVLSRLAMSMAPMGFLRDDVTNPHAVTAADFAAVKANLNKPLSNHTYLFDLNVDGTISPSDVSVVKARVGLVLP